MVGIVLQIGQLPLEALWGSAVGFVLLVTFAVAGIGLASRSLAVGAYGSYMAFAFFAVHSNIGVLTPILYASLVMIVLGTSFKLWKLEGTDA